MLKVCALSMLLFFAVSLNAHAGIPVIDKQAMVDHWVMIGLVCILALIAAFVSVITWLKLKERRC